MPLPAVSALDVAQPSLNFPEGLVNYPVLFYINCIFVVRHHADSHICSEELYSSTENIYENTFVYWGHVVALLHCATNRKVTGSIPDGVTGIFI